MSESFPVPPLAFLISEFCLLWPYFHSLLRPILSTHLQVIVDWLASSTTGAWPWPCLRTAARCCSAACRIAARRRTSSWTRTVRLISTGKVALFGDPAQPQPPIRTHKQAHKYTQANIHMGVCVQTYKHTYTLTQLCVCVLHYSPVVLNSGSQPDQN